MGYGPGYCVRDGNVYRYEHGIASYRGEQQQLPGQAAVTGASSSYRGKQQLLDLLLPRGRAAARGHLGQSGATI